jgi:hypothetical protein
MIRRAGGALTAVAAAGILVAACGSAAAPAPGQAGSASVPASSLETSVTTAAGTWAAVEMGGSAAQHNNFWQLFVRPEGGTRWNLVTPPGTADNGGLVLAAGQGQSLVTGFRPSQLLTFTPLSQTADNGSAWSAISPLDAALASTPGAMAMQPGSGRLLALTGRGTTEESTAGSATWHTLASSRAIAGTRAGRRCGLRALTAVGWTTSGAPLTAGACARPGTAGIFADESGTWQAAGPALPGSLARQPVTVLQLATIGTHTTALLTAGAGRSASMVAAWSSRSGGSWTLSAPLPLTDDAPVSASFGPGGEIALVTPGGRAAVTAPGSRSWQTLPALPSGTATLAVGASGQLDALAVHAASLTVWLLGPRRASWIRTQAIKVPIPYGSSS